MEEKLILVYEMSGLYDKITIKDSVYKDMNNDSLFIIKNGQKQLLSKIDFGCTR